MRTEALEASVSAAAGVTLTKPTGSGGALTNSKGSSAEVNGTLDLAALLGVEEAGKGSKGMLGSNNGVNNQINVQMISILQSQRDQYKDKLTRASTFSYIRLQYINSFDRSLFVYSIVSLFIRYYIFPTIAQAETSLQRMQVDLEAAQSAKTRLETDNLALYSKIRYLQSYGGSGGSQMYKSPQVLFFIPYN